MLVSSNTFNNSTFLYEQLEFTWLVWVAITVDVGGEIDALSSTALALIIVLIWFLASLVGLIVRSVRMGTRLLTGLTVFCVAVFAYYLWLG